MSTPEVMNADVSQRERCVAAQVLAFASDPLLRWMLPDPLCYLTYFPEVLQFYGGRAFDHGSAYRTSDFGGSAMWLPPGIGPDEEALGAVVQEAVDPNRVEEVFGLLELVGNAHPDEPHWFLPAIGIDPTCQGRGYGAALLARSLQACDREHRVAYLEASNPRNVPLYQRFGFEVIGEMGRGDLPDGQS